MVDAILIIIRVQTTITSSSNATMAIKTIVLLIICSVVEVEAIILITIVVEVEDFNNNNRINRSNRNVTCVAGLVILHTNVPIKITAQLSKLPTWLTKYPMNKHLCNKQTYNQTFL